MSLDDLVLGRITVSTANFTASGPVGRADLGDFFVGFGTTVDGHHQRPVARLRV